MAGFMSKVSFAPKIGVLMKATSDDTKPTPGYLYDDIAKITFESLEYCDYMIDFLVDRLNKKSLQVKSKVLVVMKNVLEKGSEEFAKCLRRQSTGIQNCKGLHGPPDPLHGDTFYLNVRRNAGSVLELLFDLERKKEDSSYNQLAPSTSYSTVKMEGFGNTSNQTQESGKIKDLYGNIKDAFQSFVSTSIPSSLPLHEQQDQNYSQFGSQNRSTIQRPSDTISSFMSSSNMSQGPSKSSLSSSSSNSTKLMPETIGSSCNWLAKTSSHKTNDFWSEPKKSNKAADVDIYETEKRIIEEITAVQGIRVQPAKVDIDALIKRCHNLNCSVIVDQISLKLLEADSRVHLRAMFVIESMLESTLPEICELIESNCKERLLELKSSSHTATRNKSQKILNMLGVIEAPIGLPSHTNSGPSKTDILIPSDNLFGDMNLQAPPQPQTSQQSSSQSTTSRDIINFASLQPSAISIGQNSQNQPINNTLDIGFDPFSQPMAASDIKATLPPPQQQNLGSFPFISQPPLADTQLKNNNTSLVQSNDLFDNNNPIQNKPAPASTGNDFFADFDNLSVKDSPKSQAKTPTNDFDLDPFGSSSTPSQQPLMNSALATSNYTSPQQASMNFPPVTSNYASIQNNTMSSTGSALGFRDLNKSTTNNLIPSSSNKPTSSLDDIMSNFSMSPKPKPISQPIGAYANVGNTSTQQQQHTSMNNFNNFSNNNQQQSFQNSMQTKAMNPTQQTNFTNSYQGQSQFQQQQMGRGSGHGMKHMAGPGMYVQPQRFMGSYGNPQQQHQPNTSFLRNNSSEQSRNNDSFNFVQDAMKASKK